MNQLSVNRTLSPLKLSALIHFVFLAIIALAAYLMAQPAQKKLKTMKVQVIEVPATPLETPKAIEISQPAPEVVESSKPPPVFGLTEKSLTSEGADVQVKLGNTIAKEIDQIDNDGKDSLPIPVDEFLITKMPRVISEVRVPFPAEARKLGIQGAVIADLLIDTEGLVRDVTLVQGLSPILDQLALDALKGFKFQPASVGDQTVAVKIRYSYRFTLE